jgi:hypothetical protein
VEAGCEAAALSASATICGCSICSDPAGMPRYFTALAATARRPDLCPIDAANGLVCDTLNTAAFEGSWTYGDFSSKADDRDGVRGDGFDRVDMCIAELVSRVVAVRHAAAASALAARAAKGAGVSVRRVVDTACLAVGVPRPDRMEYPCAVSSTYRKLFESPPARPVQPPQRTVRPSESRAADPLELDDKEWDSGGSSGSSDSEEDSEEDSEPSEPVDCVAKREYEAGAFVGSDSDGSEDVASVTCSSGQPWRHKQRAVLPARATQITRPRSKPPAWTTRSPRRP